GPHHPGRDVRAGGLAHDPGAQQVQAEVAGAGADLERALEPFVERAAEHLAELADDLSLTDLAEGDAPLGVVARGGDVVIAGIHIADLARGPQPLHGGRDITLRPPMGASLQENQPPGVPPLELTGERTLPDVPAENYWYRRHLAVYEWIAV